MNRIILEDRSTNSGSHYFVVSWYNWGGVRDAPVIFISIKLMKRVNISVNIALKANIMNDFIYFVQDTTLILVVYLVRYTSI